MPYSIQVNGLNPIEIEDDFLPKDDARSIIENLLKSGKYTQIHELIKNSEDIKCKRTSSIKKKESQIEKYLFLYELFLEIFGATNWHDLKPMVSRDNSGLITIERKDNFLISDAELSEAIDNVNDYENQLRSRYGKDDFEYTDYQVFAILFTELFLIHKYDILDTLRSNLHAKSKELHIVSNEQFTLLTESDFEDVIQKTALTTGSVKKDNTPNVKISKTFEENQEEYNSNEALFLEKYFNIISKDSYLSSIQKLAFYMATGSGKTVIFHTNILQALKQDRNANLYLIVPTKELGRQHKRDLIDFSFTDDEIGFYEDDTKTGSVTEAVTSLLTQSYKLKILTNNQLNAINKRRIHFAGTNIVFVDEGHKGDSKEGGWREDRKTILGDNGFAFEYSATFSQAIKDDKNLLQEYSKSIIFDYPYHKYYNDNYGKKAEFEPKEKVVNDFKDDISDTEQEELFVKDMLAFLEQKLYFYNNSSNGEFLEHNFEDPLKLIICRKVDNKKNDSDVKKAVDFISSFSTKNKKAIIKWIKKLKEQFNYLKSTDEKELYKHIFKHIFNADKPSSIHAYKLNDKEIGLKVEGSNEYFAVVYVGDVKNVSLEDLEDDKMQGSLINDFFNHGDNKSINLVISARMLIEGWDTQRISSLSLFDFGKQPGSLIVQLFGRGVRLHGKTESRLKRTGTHPIMERFNIYGYESAYLKKFIEESELGEIAQQETIEINIEIDDIHMGKNLNVVKPKSGFESTNFIYQHDQEFIDRIISRKIKYDWSVGKESIEIVLQPFLQPKKFFSQYMTERKYRNFVLTYMQFETIFKQIFERPIQIKKSYVIQDLLQLESIATKMVHSFFEHYYKAIQKEYEFNNTEIKVLDKTDSNLTFETYQITGRSDAIANLIDGLKSAIGRDPNHSSFYSSDYDHQNFIQVNNTDFAIKSDQHIYHPLLIENSSFSISPDRLVPSEVSFLKSVRRYCKQANAEDFVLLRNQQKIGFKGFYPDFIMWYFVDDIEHFVFIDPKGINNFNIADVWDKIIFSYEIKKIEQSLKSTTPNLRLHSFILATKSIEELVQNEVSRTFITSKLSQLFGSLPAEIDDGTFEMGLNLINVLSLKDEKLIDKLIQEIRKDNTQEIVDFIKKINPFDTKLERFMDDFHKTGSIDTCPFIDDENKAKIYFLYKEVFKRDDLSDAFCQSLEDASVGEIIEETRNEVIENIIEDIGMELLLDCIPFARTGGKVASHLFRLHKK